MTPYEAFNSPPVIAGLGRHGEGKFRIAGSINGYKLEISGDTPEAVIGRFNDLLNGLPEDCYGYTPQSGKILMCKECGFTHCRMPGALPMAGWKRCPWEVDRQRAVEVRFIGKEE